MSEKNDFLQGIDDVFDTLQRQRDRLRVKVSLAKMEGRDEWRELEQQWQEFESKRDRLKNELAPTMDDVHHAWLLLKDEIGDGYEKFRRKL